MTRRAVSKEGRKEEGLPGAVIWGCWRQSARGDNLGILETVSAWGVNLGMLETVSARGVNLGMLETICNECVLE